jgi:hypothetical protein
VRSRNFLKASGASAAIAEDAAQFVRKLIGSSRKVKTQPAGGEGGSTSTSESTATHSSSQMSYDNRVGNFESYIERLKNVPEYNPNEVDLTVTALTA